MERATVSFMRRIADDMDRTPGKMGPSRRALEAVLASDAAKERATRGATERQLPFRLDLDQAPEHFSGRTAERVYQLIVTPLIEVIEDPSVPLDRNPLHPYFFSSADYDALHAMLGRGREAGFDDSSLVLAAMTRTASASVNRQHEVMPEPVESGSWQAPEPYKLWHARVVGQDRRSNAMGTGHTPKPYLAECWGHEEALYGEISGMSEHVFPADPIKGQYLITAAAGLHSPSAIPSTFSDPQRLHPELREAFDDAGIRREDTEPVPGKAIQSRAFRQLADGDLDEAVATTIGLGWCYPGSMTDGRP